MRRIMLALSVVLAGASGAATEALGDYAFPSIDGGVLEMSEWSGRPVLVVNTASRCGYTPQYEDLQALYDRYRDRGLVVLAVPSDTFRQELASNEDVRDFCELTYGLDLPMTEITEVRGAAAHPFYRWLAEDHGFVPDWNFNKVLIGPGGEFAGAWGARVRPGAGPIVDRIEAFLAE